MIGIRTIGLAISLGAFAFVSSAIADDDMVYGYAVSSSGKYITSSSGECVRTSTRNSMDKPEVCGYAQPVVEKVDVKKIEIVVAPTAISITEKVNEEIVIGAAILFEFDSDVLSEDGKQIISERIGRFSSYKKSNVEVRVIGHTDSTGPEAYNQILSERRAKSVGDYIEKMKQSPDANVEISGMGETQPISSNDTKEGRTANRRVNIMVTGTVQK